MKVCTLHSNVAHKRYWSSDVMQESDIRDKHGLLSMWTLTLWMSWVPQMKRTELSPAPYFWREVCAAAIISGCVCNTSHSRVEYLSVLHIETSVLIVSWFQTLHYWSHQLWSWVLAEKLRGPQIVKSCLISWNVKVHYCIHKSLQPVHILVCISSVPALHPTYLRSVLISSHICQGLRSSLFLSCFPINTLYAPALSLIHATCPPHLFLLDLISRIIFGEEYRSWSSTSHSWPH